MNYQIHIPLLMTFYDEIFTFCHNFVATLRKLNVLSVFRFLFHTDMIFTELAFFRISIYMLCGFSKLVCFADVADKFSQSLCTVYFGLVPILKR